MEQAYIGIDVAKDSFVVATKLADLFNLLHQFLHFPLPQADRIIKPVVVATAAHLEHSAHLLDGKLISVLFYESEYRPPPLKKMLMVIFRISRSNCASFNSFCSRFIFFLLFRQSFRGPDWRTVLLPPLA